MEQSPRETNTVDSRLIKKLPALYKPRKFYYRLQRSWSPAPILSQINQVHATIPLLKIPCDIMLRVTPSSSK